MRVQTKKVYYCDFCGKRRLQRKAMEKHEMHCTLNPDRICRWFLPEYPDVKQHTTRRGLARWLRLRAPLTKEIIEKLREEACGCPACMLSALRQSGLKDIHYGVGYGRVFDYEEEVMRYRADEQEYWQQQEWHELQGSWL